jgi:hypothetical protein
MSRRIANELAKEFANQAQLEQAASLPCTVMIAPDDVGKAKIELGFIGAFAEACPRQCSHAPTDSQHARAEFVVAPLYVTLAVRMSGMLCVRCNSNERRDSRRSSHPAAARAACRSSTPTATCAHAPRSTCSAGLV